METKTDSSARGLLNYLITEDLMWGKYPLEGMLDDVETLCEVALLQLRKQDDEIRRLRQRADKLGWIIKGAAELLTFTGR